MNVERAFGEVSRRLLASDAAVEQGPIMHSTGLRLGGRFFAFARRGELVVKLPAERVTELVAGGGGGPFVGSGGRVMREWVTLQPPHLQACAAYVREARSFASR